MPAEEFSVIPELPVPDTDGNFIRVNSIHVVNTFVLRVFKDTPTDADFMYPVDGSICLVSGAKELKPDQLYVRINGVWKGTPLT